MVLASSSGGCGVETLKAISAHQAAAVMAAAGVADPAGLHTPASIAASGHCYALETDAGRGVFVCEKRGGQLWIHGAGSTDGTGMIHTGMDTAEALSRHAGCDSVAFQTARPGLVRIAKRRGYRVVGVILEKK